MPSLNIDLHFFSHRKTMRLIAQLGDHAVSCLVRLWCYAGQHYPETGSFHDMNDIEIEGIMQWRGEPGLLVRTLISIGFLDIIDRQCHIHGWRDHAGHLVRYKKRAQVAAAARWDDREHATSNASSILSNSKINPLCLEHATSNAKSSTSISPVQCSAVQCNTKKEEIDRQVSKKPTKPTLTDDEWLEELKKNPAYAHIDFSVQNGKMDAWLSLPQNKNRIKSRKFILSWLNRIEKPVSTGIITSSQGCKERIFEGNFLVDCKKPSVTIFKGRPLCQEHKDYHERKASTRAVR